MPPTSERRTERLARILEWHTELGVLRSARPEKNHNVFCLTHPLIVVAHVVNSALQVTGRRSDAYLINARHDA